MGIFAVGAYYDKDISDKFIEDEVFGLAWPKEDAPELHQFIKSLKVGDIVYIKSVSPSSKDILIKAIGVISNGDLIENNSNVTIGRNIKWLVTDNFRIPKPREKNNVRMNTMYEEFHPEVQTEILNKIFNDKVIKN